MKIIYNNVVVGKAYYGTIRGMLPIAQMVRLHASDGTPLFASDGTALYAPTR